jgi:ATP-dependent Clp protease ATP-binding subunit ClpA
VDESAVDGAVEKIFTPEFRNRLDSVVRFGHLSREIMTGIVNKELAAFRNQLTEKKVRLEVTAACISRLAEEGYSREFGARNVGRIIEDRIKSFFVDEVLFGSLSSGGAARVDYRDGAYHLDLPEDKNGVGGDAGACRIGVFNPRCGPETFGPLDTEDLLAVENPAKCSAGGMGEEDPSPKGIS